MPRVRRQLSKYPFRSRGGMTKRDLWSHFYARKVFHTRPFDRDLIWVKREDFLPLREHFVQEYNIIYPGASWRSKHYMRHVQAVEQGEFVLIHKDLGNVALFLPLGLLHLVVDIVPYVLLARARGVSFKSFFTIPQ